jgi:hypothetical protein
VIYLLDANVLITAHSYYYPVDAVPEFWSWVAHQAASNKIKIPIEIYEEIKDGSNDAEQDLLYAWIQDSDHKKATVLSQDVDPALVQRVIADGYANDLTDDELEQLGRDPFLIAYALAAPSDYCVVTTEVSKPRKQRQNRRIPDVCTTLGLRCIDTFTMLRELQFRTNWNQGR